MSISKAFGSQSKKKSQQQKMSKCCKNNPNVKYVKRIKNSSENELTLESKFFLYLQAGFLLLMDKPACGKKPKSIKDPEKRVSFRKHGIFKHVENKEQTKGHVFHEKIDPKSL